MVSLLSGERDSGDETHGLCEVREFVGPLKLPIGKDPLWIRVQEVLQFGVGSKGHVPKSRGESRYSGEAMAIRHDQGIVLRSYPFGEADRVVVLLSPSTGKLRTVAKGVRKTKSRFGGRLEPFTHVDLVLYEGRNLDTITQVAVLEPFPKLRGDLDSVVAAGTMVEAADAVAQEDENEVRLFLLLQRGLKALEMGLHSPDLITAYLLKLADVVGVAPALEHCASCGRTDGLTRFSFGGGGSVCDTCRVDGAVRLRHGITGYMAGLADADFGSLPPLDESFSSEAMGIARRFVEYHLDRKLASLAVME